MEEQNLIGPVYQHSWLSGLQRPLAQVNESIDQLQNQHETNDFVKDGEASRFSMNLSPQAFARAIDHMGVRAKAPEPRTGELGVTLSSFSNILEKVNSLRDWLYTMLFNSRSEVYSNGDDVSKQFYESLEKQVLHQPKLLSA